MKHAIHWMIALVMISVSSMLGLYWYSAQQSKQKIALMRNLTLREGVIADLTLELERFRRLSGSFRKYPGDEIASIKGHLKNEFTQSESRLEKLDSTEDERVLATQAVERLSELMLLGAKLEPQIYTRDIYVKNEIQKIHQSILDLLAELKAKAEARAQATASDAAPGGHDLFQLLIVLGAVVVALMLTSTLFQYLALSRPLDKLRLRMREIREGKPGRSNHPPLPGFYGEIERMIKDLTLSVGNQKMERHQFLTAVANDFRPPLVALQAGANAFFSTADPSQRAQALESVRRSTTRLSRLMEDLLDITQLDRAQLTLTENIIDVRELLEKVVETMTGPGSLHVIDVTAPRSPIWTLADGHKLERVLINLISKLTSGAPQGMRVHLSLTRLIQGTYRGIEILLQEATRTPGTRSAPERDVLQHWVAENGFGLALSQKIIKAHGGTLTAAGEGSGSLQFRIRLPEERIASDGLPSAGIAAIRSGALEGARIQPMLSEQAINLGT